MILMDAHKGQRMTSLRFLERYQNDENAFLYHTAQVTGDETCVSFIHIENKQ
jgi:hypothetical protein